MQEHKYPTAFPLKHAQKDMRLALELAHQHGQELPTAAAANGLYEQVSFKALIVLLSTFDGCAKGGTVSILPRSPKFHTNCLCIYCTQLLREDQPNLQNG